MAVCMYFMCGFHQIGVQRGAERCGAAYAVQGTFEDQRLGINAANYSAPSRFPQAALDSLRTEIKGLGVGGDDVCVPLLLSETESNIEDEDAEEECIAEDTL